MVSSTKNAKKWGCGAAGGIGKNNWVCATPWVVEGGGVYIAMGQTIKYNRRMDFVVCFRMMVGIV